MYNVIHHNSLTMKEGTTIIIKYIDGSRSHFIHIPHISCDRFYAMINDDLNVLGLLYAMHLHLIKLNFILGQIVVADSFDFFFEYK